MSVDHVKMILFMQFLQHFPRCPQKEDLGSAPLVIVHRIIKFRRFFHFFRCFRQHNDTVTERPVFLCQGIDHIFHTAHIWQKRRCKQTDIHIPVPDIPLNITPIPAVFKLLLHFQERSSDRKPIASKRCSCRISSEPARSAIVRATRRIRSYALALKPNCWIACRSMVCMEVVSWQNC